MNNDFSSLQMNAPVRGRPKKTAGESIFESINQNSEQIKLDGFLNEYCDKGSRGELEYQKMAAKERLHPYEHNEYNKEAEKEKSNADYNYASIQLNKDYKPIYSSIMDNDKINFDSSSFNLLNNEKRTDGNYNTQLLKNKLASDFDLESGLLFDNSMNQLNEIPFKSSSSIKNKNAIRSLGEKQNTIVDSYKGYNMADDFSQIYPLCENSGFMPHGMLFTPPNEAEKRRLSLNESQAYQSSNESAENDVLMDFLHGNYYYSRDYASNESMRPLEQNLFGISDDFYYEYTNKSNRNYHFSHSPKSQFRGDNSNNLEYFKNEENIDYFDNRNQLKGTSCPSQQNGLFKRDSSAHSDFQNTGNLNKKMDVGGNYLYRQPVEYSAGTGYVRKKRKSNTPLWDAVTSQEANVPPSKYSSLEFVKSLNNSENAHKSPSKNGLAGSLLQQMNQYSNKFTDEQKSILCGFKEAVSKLDLDNITVFELKVLMRDFGLNMNGKKNELIKFLKETIKRITEIDISAPNKSTICKPSENSFEKIYF